MICDPWHYLPVLEKKLGSLRNGAPFVEWDLPVPTRLVSDRVLKQPKGGVSIAVAFKLSLVMASLPAPLRSSSPVVAAL